MKSLPIKNTSLTLEETNLILKARFTITRLDKIRDIFLFSCFTGLSYNDIKNLTINNLVIAPDGKYWLKIYVQKSNTPIKIPLLDTSRTIIEKYRNSSNETGSLLPVPSIQKTNYYLKEVGKECKLEKHLTFNFARHTFICTIIMGNDLETSIVNKLIGRKVQGNSKITDFQLYKAMKTVSEKLKGNNIINI